MHCNCKKAYTKHINGFCTKTLSLCRVRAVFIFVSCFHDIKNKRASGGRGSLLRTGRRSLSLKRSGRSIILTFIMAAADWPIWHSHFYRGSRGMKYPPIRIGRLGRWRCILSGGSELPKTKCFLDETYQFQQNGFCVKTLYLYFRFEAVFIFPSWFHWIKKKKKTSSGPAPSGGSVLRADLSKVRGPGWWHQVLAPLLVVGPTPVAASLRRSLHQNKKRWNLPPPSHSMRKIKQLPNVAFGPSNNV